MAAPEDTRRCIIERSEHERWVARPFDDPNGQEVIVLSKRELLHALPCCDPDISVPPPPAEQDKLYVVTAGTLNVRMGPNTGQAPVGTLPNGAQVWCVVHNESWLRITRGEFAGRFIAAAYTRPM